LLPSFFVSEAAFRRIAPVTIAGVVPFSRRLEIVELGAGQIPFPNVKVTEGR
jgi:hypothetical protein